MIKAAIAPRVIDAVFLGSGTTPEQLPRHPYPEVAIVGRSNVGKSTFLNRLTQRRDIARVSNRPGRTTEINLFEATLRDAGRPDYKIVFADLPGYGYAKVSKQKHKQLIRSIADYLAERDPLKVLCLLNDCRREADADEFAVRDAVFENERHLLVVLTKLDKLGAADKRKAIEARAREYMLQTGDFMLSGEGISINDVVKRIVDLISLSGNTNE